MLDELENNTQETMALLRGVQGFSELDHDTLTKMAQNADYQHVLRGDALVHEGETADSLYIVLKGRFLVIVGDTPIAEISMGEPIGELAFFAGGTRTATVVAARNSHVMCLSRATYDDLAARTPSLSNGILSALSRRLALTTSATPEMRLTAGKICSVFPGGGGPMDPRFVAALKNAFAKVEGWKLLDETKLPADAAFEASALTAWLEAEETSSDSLILLCSDPDANQVWRKVAAENSDSMFIALAKTESAANAPRSSLEVELMSSTLQQNIQLVLFREHGTQGTTGTAPWLVDRPAALHHHVALDDPADFDRLARFIRGEAIGLVLCGGGSFGTAHLGALKALLERGYSFDFVGGTSVGSAMAGALALGHAPDHVMDICEDLFIRSKAMSRLTIPKFGVLDHHRLDDALRHHFGAFNIEDSPINFFAVATSLTDNTVRTMRRGPLWKAIRASSSVPGIFPAVVMDDGEVLIDGGLMDNAPVTTMRGLKAGPNLVLNFLANRPWRAKSRYENLPTRWKALAALIMPGGKRRDRHPTIFSILSRSMVVNARKLLNDTDMEQDVLMNIAVFKRMSFLDWKQGRALFETSYTNMSQALADLTPKDAPTDTATAMDRMGVVAKTINAQTEA